MLLHTESTLYLRLAYSLEQSSNNKTTKQNQPSAHRSHSLTRLLTCEALWHCKPKPGPLGTSTCQVGIPAAKHELPNLAASTFILTAVLTRPIYLLVASVTSRSQGALGEYLQPNAHPLRIMVGGKAAHFHLEGQSPSAVSIF